MKKYRTFFRYAAGAIALFVLLFCAGGASAQESTEENNQAGDRILFISSYSWTWPTVPLQMAGIQSALDWSVVLDVEFMDTKSLPQEFAEHGLQERILAKQEQGLQYDAVIVGDDAALHFAMEYRQELFDGIPIVFEGINNIEYAEEVSQDPLVTGVIECFSYSENLDFALRIQPDAKRILAIVDNTVTGIGEQQQFFEHQKEYPQLSFEVLNGSLMTGEELVSAISEAGDDTILVYLILSEDADGNLYTNEQVCSMIREYAHVPVLRFVQAGIGEGVLGGNIVFHDEAGAIAGQMVKEMLNGTDPASVEMISDSPNGFYLDQNVLERFSIPEKLIPGGAVVINRKPGFWEEHGRVVLITMAAAASLMALMALAMRAVYEHRRSVELEDKNRQLAQAVQSSQEANGAKSRFLAQMSHEIRTPMNAVIGLTALAKAETDIPDKIREYLNKIDASSRLLLGIINDILDMSAIERGKMKLDSAPFDFKKQLSSVVTMFYQQAKQKGVDFRVHMNDVTEETLVGDELRVSQIMMNLLSNAVKFTPTGGRVDFTVTQTSRSSEKVFMRFEVRDTGCGMNEDMMSRLFWPFEQQDASTARFHGGSGLGLSITGSLVQMMGGTIRVESAQGEGSVFIADIPFRASEENLPQRNSFEDLRTLVVDDNRDDCRYCGNILERMGVRFDYVTDGESALEALGEAEDEGDPYRLCIVDWQMKAMNGLELTGQIRSVFGNDAVVILVSAFDLNEIREDGKKAGADYFVEKPLFQSSLFNTLQKIAGKTADDTHDQTSERYDFSGHHVLLAEDVELNMEVAVGLLNSVGVEVNCAWNGKEALEIYRKMPEYYFDCILLDINMPEMDGYETVRAIRSSGRQDSASVCVYAMTANAFSEDVTAAMDAGMNGHIGKPIEPGILYGTLQEVFKKHEQI